MISVSVKNAIFHAPIGLYPQESKTLNQIAVDVSISQEAQIQTLPFIDYALLYQQVKEVVMEQHHKTLEAVVSDIYQRLIELHPGSKLSIQVRKLNPPISGRVDYMEVSFVD